VAGTLHPGEVCILQAELAEIVCGVLDYI
jgi:hypothetical protein